MQATHAFKYEAGSAKKRRGARPAAPPLPPVCVCVCAATPFRLPGHRGGGRWNGRRHPLGVKIKDKKESRAAAAHSGMGCTRGCRGRRTTRSLRVPSGRSLARVWFIPRQGWCREDLVAQQWPESSPYPSEAESLPLGAYWVAVGVAPAAGKRRRERPGQVGRPGEEARPLRQST